MLIKLTGFVVFALLFMMTPAFANVTSVDLEKSVYFDNEFIKFVGTQDGKDVVYITIHDALDNFKEILSDLNPNQGEFLVSSSLTQNKVSDIFEVDGIYNATAYTNEQKQDNGIILRLEYKNNIVSVIEDVLLALKSIPDYSVEVEKTITFTASLENDSVEGSVFSLDEEAPSGATIDPSSGFFVWTPLKSHGSFQDVPYSFNIVVKSGAQEDREKITITVKKAYDEPETTESEPETTESEPETTEPELKELEIPAPFVDETKEPQSYVDRYNNEASYKKWFDDNYPEYSSIYEAVGLEEQLEIPAPFVDETKEPQSYVDRYNNEASYKKWFDDNYPEYSSIYEAVGLEEQ
ncbi:MAG: Ig domain-containing protein, partial [Nitrosopumilus sp.]